MPVSKPFLSPRGLLGPPSGDGVLGRFREADVRSVSLFGHGKVALREVLSRADGAGSDVLLPGYVTAGVVGAVEAAGCRPRFYRLRPDLSPNLDDLAAKLDDDVLAALAIHYFGFPTADVDELGRLCEEQGCYLLVDNAHSPLSRDGTRPLGTGGDAGFTSLHKQFPVPDGAVLVVSNPDLLPDGDVSGGAPATVPHGHDGGSGGEESGSGGSVGHDGGSGGHDGGSGCGSRPAATPGERGVSGRYTTSDLAFCAESMLCSFVFRVSRRLERFTVGHDGVGDGSVSLNGGPPDGAGNDADDGRRTRDAGDGTDHATSTPGVTADPDGDVGTGRDLRPRTDGLSDAVSVKKTTDAYRNAQARASRLSLRVVERVDPDRVVRARRRNYRFWLDVTTHGIEGISGCEPTAEGEAEAGVAAVEGAGEAADPPAREAEAPPATPPFRTLPDGVCPQVFPLVVEDPDALSRSVGPLDGITTWPPLPPAVAGAGEFRTANYLANHLVRLPVHQGVDPWDLVPVARRVREYVTGGP